MAKLLEETFEVIEAYIFILKDLKIIKQSTVFSYNLLNRARAISEKNKVF